MDTTKVKCLAKQIRGVSYKPKDLHDSLDDNSVILLRANNIDDGKINFDDVVYVDKSKVSDEQYLKEGDVLICTSSGSKKLVGKAASVNFDLQCTFGAFCKVIRPNAEVVDYLGIYFQSDIYRRKISEVALGANINNIRNEHIDSLELPSYDSEQSQVIVRKISLLQTIMDNRKDELGKLDELIKSRFVEMFGDNTYPKVKAAEICDFITKGTTPASKDILPSEEEDTIPYLKVYNLSFTGDLLFRQESQYISREIHEGKLARSKVYPNDVLMNIVGPPLGKFALVTDEYSEWNINQAIAIFRAKERILPKFLLSALMQEKVIQPFIDQAVGVRQLNISLEQCRNLELILPPLEEQKKYVSFVEQVNKSKVAVQKALDETQMLFDSLMQKYFG